LNDGVFTSSNELQITGTNILNFGSDQIKVDGATG
jgi:hypothetical protein